MDNRNDNLDLTFVKTALRNALIEEADAEISRLTAEFEQSLHRKKEEAVAKLLSGIQITAERNAGDAVFDIRIRFRGGGDDDR